MANAQFQPSSFIPKKTLSSSGSEQRPKRSVNVFLLIASIVFVVSILGAGGVFLYERVVMSNIEQQKTQLNRAREAFEPRLIEELARLDKRINVAENLLNQHITVSPFFELLGTLTLKSISFETFAFSKDELGNLLVKMDGIAENYTSIALQSDLFGNNEHIIDPIFSNFVLDSDARVTFGVELSIDDGLLLYENSIN